MTAPDPTRSLTSARANSFPWPPVLLAAVVASAVALGRWVALPWPGLDDMAAHTVGLGFGVAGIVLVIWSIIALRRAGTTVMPNGVSSALVTSGPYARFRNPIYLGEVLLLLFFAEWTQNIWFAVAALIFAVAITPLQIVPEERHLSATFGAPYDDYRSRSRRWI